MENQPRYLTYLDAARGIAALMVASYHYINWKYDSYTSARLASIVLNGSDAVSFFFVLSGFVLSYQYIVLKNTLDIKKFYIARFFRLWPAYFVTVVINAISANRAHMSGLHQVIDIFLKNKTHFWEEAILLRNRLQYYVPGWTLSIELALSFFIPFWVIIARNGYKIILWLLAAYLLIGNNMRDLYMFHFHFALGVLISCMYDRITNESFKQTLAYRYRLALLAGAFVLFSVRHLDRLVPFNERYKNIANYLGIDFFHYTALGSFIFIAYMVISAPLQRVLEHRILRFLGKISYGIYLMHWVLVSRIFDDWQRIVNAFGSAKTAFVVTFCLYIAATVILASIVHYTIELPFTRLAKKFTARLRPSYVIASADNQD